jgi:hypothetical protein
MDALFPDVSTAEGAETQEGADSESAETAEADAVKADENV